MKTFYTERDVQDLHRAGVTEIVVTDDVVLTDLGREKALDLGIQLNAVTEQTGQAGRPLRKSDAHLPPPAIIAAKTASFSKKSAGSINSELVQRIKSGVIAKLGTTEYNDLLDQIIPQVLTRLNSQ